MQLTADVHLKGIGVVGYRSLISTVADLCITTLDGGH